MNRHTHSRSSPADSPLTREQGFSLIELMIAIALSLVLLGGAVAIFVSSRATYETTDRLSRIQDNGRFALDSIVRDLRSAGYVGCSRLAPLNNLLEKPDGLQWNFEFGVQGLNASGSGWTPALGSKTSIAPEAGTDVLVVHAPVGEFEPVRVVSGSLMSRTTDDIVTEDNAALIDVGDIVQISDCNARSIFQVTSANAGVIGHAANIDFPGNTTNDLGYAYTDTAELVTLAAVVYYIGTTPNDQTDGAPARSLFRQTSDRGLEELAPGVENMQLLFGERDSGALHYRRADEVNDWSHVETVRIALLVRSTSEYGTDRDNRSYELLDSKVAAPNDRHLRQVFTTTVGVRNNPS